MKVCSRCKTEKELDQYYKCKKSKSGYEGVCKQCRNDSRKIIKEKSNDPLKKLYDFLNKNLKTAKVKYEYDKPFNQHILEVFDGEKTVGYHQYDKLERVIEVVIDDINEYILKFKKGKVHERHNTFGWNGQ